MRWLQEIAEVLEKEGNKEESIMFYEQAGDLFHTENSTSESNKCNLKVRGRCAGWLKTAKTACTRYS